MCIARAPYKNLDMQPLTLRATGAGGLQVLMNCARKGLSRPSSGTTALSTCRRIFYILEGFEDSELSKLQDIAGWNL
jgi:hypothetical protein